MHAHASSSHTHCFLCGTEGVPRVIKQMHERVCPKCGLMWLEKKILDEKYYDSLPILKDPEKLQARERNSRDRIRTIARFVTPDHLCDIGTGEGTFLTVLKKVGFIGGFGIEPSGEGVELAHKAGLNVIRGGIGDLPQILTKQPASVFTMFHVIEHLDDPPADMKLLFDAMPSGSHLFIETPDINGYSPSKVGDLWKLFYPEHLTYFGLTNLHTLMVETGFTVIAQGRRDFDRWHLPLTDALFRLGLRKVSPKASVERQESSFTQLTEPKPAKKSNVPKWIREAIIRLMSIAIWALRRYDYQWILVRKP